MDGTKATLIGVVLLLAVLWWIGLGTDEHADDTYYCESNCSRLEIP